LNEKETWFEKIGRIINIAANAVLMNLMFLVACIPVVTIGPAWNGLFSAIRYHIRGDKWFTGFKVGYKTRFWRSLLSWVVMLIPICIILFFDVISPVLTEGFLALTAPGRIAKFLIACLMAMMLAGFDAALILLNVYIPTSVSNWLRNGANMFFKAPLTMAAVGALMWFPAVLAFVANDIFFYFVMVFVVAYYMLAAVAITLIMKNTLLEFLLEARADGTLLSEEGKKHEDAPEKEDDENEQDTEENI
jgi:hypothetical protein